jgi:hypothetical protein
LARPKNAKKRARARGASGARGPARPAAERGGSAARAPRPASTGARRGGAGERDRVRYRETSGRDWRRTIPYLALFLASVVVAVTVIEPRRGFAAAALMVLVTLWMLVAWHNRAYAYRCANCRRVFQVPTLVNFLSFQGVGRRPDGTYRGWKSLTCPYCHQRTKATVVRKLESAAKPKGRSPGSDAQLLR